MFAELYDIVTALGIFLIVGAGILSIATFAVIEMYIIDKDGRPSVLQPEDGYTGRNLWT